MKATNTTQQRDQAVRKRLIASLGITEERMFWLEWELGMKYLETQCMGNQQSIKAMQGEGFYWRWFMQYWYSHNELFFTEYAACTHVTWGIYIEFHKHLLLNEAISMNYMHYMTAITKTESKKISKQYAKAE